MGLADLWNGDVKAKNDAKLAAMKLAKENHEAAMRRKEEANEKEIRDRKEREGKLQQQEKDEKDYAAKRQKELIETQNTLRKLNDVQYNEISKDNKDRLEKTAEMNENILKTERIRESEDKNKLADRMAAEKIRVEDRQKEIEAEQGERIREAEKERSALQDAKIAEVQQNALKLDQERSKHKEALIDLKKKQDEAELIGSQYQVLFAQRQQQIEGIYSKGKTDLVAAYNKDAQSRNKSNLINTIRRENESMFDSATKISAKVNVAYTRGKPTKITTSLIFKLVQKLSTSISTIRTELSSTAFQNMDSLDEERNAAAEDALETLGEITKIVGEWNSYAEEDASPEDTINGMIANLGAFDNFVQVVSKQLRNIPLPLANEQDFNAVISQTCQAITRGATIGNDRIGSIQAPSTSETKAIEK